MKCDKKISVSLTAEQHKKLEALARESFRTKSGYIRHIIRLHLQELEQHHNQDPG